MSATIGQLQESTQGRSGTPDGNVFFDTVNGKLEFFFDTEVATMAGSVANELTALNRPTLSVLYAFERSRREDNETLRQYDVFIKAVYKRAGAYNFVNGRGFASAFELSNVDASGWNEIDTSSVTQKTYYGVISLGNIESTSQPFYKYADNVPHDFARPGDVSESILVKENGGDDNTASLTVAVRTFGYTFSSKSLADVPYDVTSGDIGGFAITESEKAWITAAGYTIDNVLTTPAAPFDGMTFAKLAVPVTRTGFTGADKDFTYVLYNTGGGTVQEAMAKLDAFATSDSNMNLGTDNDGTTIQGKREEEWYTIDDDGKMVTKVFIDNLPSAELKKIIQISDDDTECTYPYYPAIEVSVGDAAKADAHAWIHIYYLDGSGDQDFGQATAVTVNDKDGVPMKGLLAGADFSGFYDYAGNTQAGLSAGVDKQIVIEVEGNGGCTAKKTLATIKNIDTNSFSCAPDEETNI